MSVIGTRRESSQKPATRRQEVNVVGLQRDQFLLPGSEVSIEAAVPMEPEAARKAIGVQKADDSVRITRDELRAVWSPPEDLPAGRHVLQIDPLLSAQGKKISDEMTIPFFLVRSSARVPKAVAVESMVRLRLTKDGPKRLPLDRPARGQYVELIKGTNRGTGAPVRLAFDASGRRVDADRMLLAQARDKQRKMGKLQPELHARLQRARADEWLDVAIWAQAEDPLHPDDRREAERAADRPGPPPKALERGRGLMERARRIADVARQMGGREVRTDEAAPVAFCRMRKRDCEAIARRDDVAGVFLYEPDGIEDLQNSIAIANSDDVHALGVKGSGVNVAVWERGPASTSNLVIAARYTSSPATSSHSQHVHGIIKNKESGKPKGHAPECSLHSANSMDNAALTWAVKDRGCTVINQSFHRASEPKSGSLSFDDVYKDWLALHWPYPTILQAAGNFWNGDPDNVVPPSSEFVNHKGYNSLAVGNHDDSAGAMSPSSVFRNPTTPHGDRELPEISGNGTGVTTVQLTMSGTSMASPALAGVTALVQSTNTTLKHWPEGCRAILLAAATRNVAGDTWWQDVVDDDDASDGTGAVNALECHRIAQQRRGRGAAPVRRGWDVGSIASGDFDGAGLSNFMYRIQVPSTWFGPRHVKVALVWASKVSTLSVLGITAPIASQLTVDLDLRIYNSRGGVVAHSGSWDNSYEVAEFDAVPGQTYDVRIRRWSGTDWTWYGLAWTVTGGLADLLTIAHAGSSRLTQVAEDLPRLAE